MTKTRCIIFLWALLISPVISGCTSSAKLLTPVASPSPLITQATLIVTGTVPLTETRPVTTTVTPTVTLTPTISPTTTRTSGLSADWQWIDPQHDSTNDSHPPNGLLSISTRKGHDLYPLNNLAAPRMLRPAFGNFDLVAVVKFVPKRDYQGAGLLVWQDESNFLRLERAFGGLGDVKGVSGIRFDKQENGKFDTVRPVAETPATSDQVNLRLQRVGSLFIASWSLPGGSWLEVGRTAVQFTDQLQVGVDVVTGADVEDTTALFSDIQFLPAVNSSLSLAEELRQTAYKALPTSLSINTVTALYQKAQENNLGFATTDEYWYSVGADKYVAQVFQKGIAYVKEGNWEGVRVTDKSATPLTREPAASEAFRLSIRQSPIAINPESLLMKEAQVSSLGNPLTGEFEFSFRNQTYKGQLFIGGLACTVKDGSADVIVFPK